MTLATPVRSRHLGMILPHPLFFSHSLVSLTLSRTGSHPQRIALGDWRAAKTVMQVHGQEERGRKSVKSTGISVLLASNIDGIPFSLFLPISPSSSLHVLSSAVAVCCTMDYLNAGLDAVQSRLAWVATDPFDWKLFLQVSSWTVCLFESYLLYVHSSYFFETVSGVL